MGKDTKNSVPKIPHKSYLTVEEVERLHLNFKKSEAKKDSHRSKGESLCQNLIGLGLPTAQNMAIVAIQMHVFDIPAEEVSKDRKEIEFLISSFGPGNKLLEKHYLEFSCGRTGFISAVDMVNAFVIFWNTVSKDISKLMFC